MKTVEGVQTGGVYAVLEGSSERSDPWLDAGREQGTMRPDHLELPLDLSPDQFWNHPWMCLHDLLLDLFPDQS